MRAACANAAAVGIYAPALTRNVIATLRCALGLRTDIRQRGHPYTFRHRPSFGYLK